MPTGRPDYWYGTALYFEDNPADGETVRGPTSNWAYDHANNPTAHQEAYDPGESRVFKIGDGIDSSDDVQLSMYTQDPALELVRILRSNVAAGALTIYTFGTGEIVFWVNGANRLKILSAGGLDLVWDDTPTDGEVYKGVTSDWAFDHLADASAHHAEYGDGDAVTAMGVKGAANPLNHDRYADGDAVTAMGVKGAGNALNHDRYTDALALTQAQSIIDDTPADADTTHAPSSNWAFDHAADANAHHAPGWVFVDRGDPAGNDRDVDDFTKDGVWRDWDMSGIVGSGVRLVKMTVGISNNNVQEAFALRENGNGNSYNASSQWITIANVVHKSDMFVLTDSSGVAEYFASSGGTWAFIDICIQGWWKVTS